MGTGKSRALDRIGACTESMFPTSVSVPVSVRPEESLVSSSTGSGAPRPVFSQPEALPKLAHPDGSPVRALVVDDEPLLADLVSMGLSMCGWEVRVAHAGRAAVEAARTFVPDVLVLDWMLPELDGLQVLAERVTVDARALSLIHI